MIFIMNLDLSRGTFSLSKEVRLSKTQVTQVFTLCNLSKTGEILV